MQLHQWQQISEFAELSGPVDGCHAWAMTDELMVNASKGPPTLQTSCQTGASGPL